MSVNLSQMIVIFRHKEVTVYPDESKKPPLGEGLNRPAEVTLERVWHIDRATKEEIRDPLKLIDLGWRDRLEKVTARMGATFKDYRPSTGSWVFRVEHFSKYGLPDDEDDADVAVVPKSRGTSTLSGDISANDLNTSLEEHHLQSHVQRAKVPKVQLHTEGGEAIHEVKGLGGRMDVDYDDEAMYEDYEIANWRDSEARFDEFQVPEKKPKMEEVLDYVYEESKRLMELSTLSVRPVRRITLTRSEPPNVFRGGVEACKTVGYKKSAIINAACAHGSSSRVSWSQGKFLCSIEELLVDNSRSAYNRHQMKFKYVRFNLIAMYPSARVRHCEIEGQSSAPRVKPADDSAMELLDSFLATATQSECVVEQRVWRLCQALFLADKSGQWHWQRAHEVGKWLRDEVASLPKKKAAGGTAIVSQIWDRMCCGDIEEAMRTANEGGLTMLSLMISAALSAEEPGRSDCANMLQMWEATNELGVLEDDLLKIYLVLAGKTHAEFKHKGKTIKLNCLEGLDWRQAFGIHLWWVNCGGFLEDALDSFSEDVAAGRAASPDSHVYEQLIRLACSPSHQVEAVLDAASMLSPNPLDAHLSWHIWSLLRALGYNTMSPAAEQRLHTSYSCLLTSLEQWHLAIFVLSHISHDQCRIVAIRDVLDRMSLTACPQDYERISAICEIPIEWIAAAKCAKAKAQGNFELACSYSLTACDYAGALRLFTEEVAPNAIAMGDLHKLRPLVERMEKVADKITGWGAVGQIYADYCELKTMDDDDDSEEAVCFSLFVIG
ncbi:unnamed protein product [Haemonchus placei]|uniref:Nuclear pore complex protein Nup98-Nup96 n=1 Tax=Haemonchus placei TaxID=6290 RepID=A0A0N4WTY3_HAEPC|nr:unnamed protein product [Haemonchus placei]